MILSDNGREITLTYDEAQSLERAGIIIPCKCHVVCGEPGKTFHLVLGKKISDVFRHFVLLKHQH